MRKHDNFALIEELPANDLPLRLHGEEILIHDARGELSPAQHVEERLVALLRRNPLTISHARSSSFCRHRSQFH